MISTAILNAVVETTTQCTKHLTADHSKMDHSQMDHSQMDHSQMDHSKMDHSSMDHSKMDHSGGHGGHGLHDGMVMSFHGGYKEIILFDFWTTDTLPSFLISCAILFVCAALYEGIKLGREKLVQWELAKKREFELVRHGGDSSAGTCRCNDSKQQSQKQQQLQQDQENQNLLVVSSGGNGTGNEAAGVPPASGGGCCSPSGITTNTAAISSKNNCKIDDSDNNNQNKKPDTIIIFKNISSRLLSRAHIVQTLLHMFQISVSYLLMLVFMTYNTWLCLATVAGAGLGYFVFGLQRLAAVDVNEHCH